jgi:hypothetical protein
MSLPGLSLQVLYVHFAWAVVLAAMGAAVLGWMKPYPTRLAASWVLLAFVACALPGPASPSYWLGLALHYPSALLVACCGMTIWLRGTHAGAIRVLPPGLAVALALVGLVLYLDSSAWLNLGLYARGFGAEAAGAGLVMGLGAVLAIARGPQRGAGFALLLSLMLFAVLRLPTGNLWDAVLDPLLWVWAIFSLASHFIRRPAKTPAPSA